MVNPFLYYYNNKRLLDTKKGDLQKAHVFSNTFGFIDDLCPKSKHQKFERRFKNIYPSELQLKKENIATSEVSLLDLFVITESKKN